MLDLKDPKWRFEERVQRLMNKGRTREEAEQTIKTVIETKELDAPPARGRAL